MDSHYRLRLPGPTEVPERVRMAMARPIPSHRGPEFRAQMTRTEDMLRPLLGTAGRVMLFAATGTGMMEAALANILRPGERLLVLIHGQFGERFAAIGASLGAQIDTLDTPWGEPIDIDAVAERIKQTAYRAVAVIHNESSTGIVADLAALGALLRDTPTLLVVDSVSGLGGVEMQMDAWGVDIVVSASQKALMCPPGLGLASLSAKALAVVHRDDAPTPFYFSFRRAYAGVEKSETAFTAPVSLIAGLHQALEMMHAEGLPNVLARHQTLSTAMREGGKALGLGIFGNAPVLSSTVVVFTLPEDIEGGQIVKALYDRYRTVIAGARNRLSGKVIRIGTMGAITPGTILTDLLHLDAVLADLGHTAPPGAALAAASAIIQKGSLA